MMSLISNNTNYIELKASNLTEIKDFYSSAFNWKLDH
jgi:predicted enzyme related to lactoylglutathione lyase